MKQHDANNPLSISIYIVSCHWVINGDPGYSKTLYTCFSDAQKCFFQDLSEERKDGNIAEWQNSPKFVEEKTSQSYECYLDDEYCENHYSISIEEVSLLLSSEFINTISRMTKPKFNMQTCIFARAKENCKQLTCRNPSYTGPKAELNPHITFAKRLTEEPLQHCNDITYIMGLCEEAAAIITMLSEKCISAEHAMMLLAQGQCCSICTTTNCSDRGNPCLCSSFQWDVPPGRREIHFPMALTKF